MIVFVFSCVYSDTRIQCHKKWFAEIMKHHYQPSMSKTKNSDMRRWADAVDGHVHVAKLFCNSLGLNALQKEKLDDVDVEAIARIIVTTLVYFTNAQKKTAHQVGVARNVCFHAPKPELSSDQFTMFGEHLKGFESELVAVGALPTAVSAEYLFGEVSMGDDHYAQLVKAYNELKTVRDLQLTSILKHLLPSSSELLRASESKCESLCGMWAAGSRQTLVSELARQVTESPNSVVHVHGCHGSGKSSLLANFTRHDFAAARSAGDAAAGGRSSAVVLLRHFFIRNDSAASVELAVCASSALTVSCIDCSSLCRLLHCACSCGPRLFPLSTMTIACSLHATYSSPPTTTTRALLALISLFFLRPACFETTLTTLIWVGCVPSLCSFQHPRLQPCFPGCFLMWSSGPANQAPLCASLLWLTLLMR
jgi:hypothetical protein